MLNENTVLEYIKDNLSWSFSQLELTDENILNYIRKHTLSDFSYYVPQVWKIPLNLGIKANKVPGVSNEWYIYDPDGLEILNVVDVYPQSGDYIATGHPPIGVFSMGELKDWALAVHNGMMVKMFSPFDLTFEFRHPNILRLSPEPRSGIVTVEYERRQPSDFSGIPNELQEFFKKLALADTMIRLGRIRKKYGGQLRTPFGEIPLESDLLEEGKELRREVIETLERLYIPNVRIDHG